MTEQHWWLILFLFEAIGLWGQWVVGKKLWWGWAVVMAHSIPWFAVSVAYGRWGAALMPPLWWAVNGFNMVRWRRDVL